MNWFWAYLILSHHDNDSNAPLPPESAVDVASITPSYISMMVYVQELAYSKKAEANCKKDPRNCPAPAITAP